MSTFDTLITDLTRDFHRVQPKDSLQFCATWFQSRLEEQRARIRDTLAHRQSLAGPLPPDHFVDHPIVGTTVMQGGTTTFTNPFPSTGSGSVFGEQTGGGGEFTNPWATASPPPAPSRRGSVHPSRSNPALRARFSRDALTSSNYSIDGTPDPHTHGNVIPPVPPIPPLPQFNTPLYDRQATPSPSYHNLNNYHLGTATGTPTILDRRMSISAEPITLDEDPNSSSLFISSLPSYPKSPAQLSRIKASISSENFLFSGLDDEQLTGVLNAMQEKKVKKNEIIILQGENGTEFYVVESGLCTVYKDDTKKAMDPGSCPQPSDRVENFTSDDHYIPDPELPGGHVHAEFGSWIIDCKPGSSFGELALMYGHARAATVVAREDSTLWVVDRETFRRIILSAASRRRNMYEHFVSMVPLLSALSPEERSKVADALVSRVYEDGEAVVTEGELGDKFYFVEDGEAVVTKLQRSRDTDGEEREIQVGHYKNKGDYFGGALFLLFSR